MKSLNELRAFCEGYRLGLTNDRAFYGATLAGLDDWIVWGGYDINLIGSEYSSNAQEENALHIAAYPANWVDNLHPSTVSQ